MAKEVDHYQRFLQRRRYERARTLPWLLMSVAGAVLMLLYVYAVFTSWLRPTERSFINPFFGGLVIAMAVAVSGLSVRSIHRWPAVLVIFGLLPLGLRLLDLIVRGRLIRGRADWLVVISFVTMFGAAWYVFFRRDPVPPAGENEMTS